MYEEAKTQLIVFFFELRHSLYLYHLSTHSYPRHVASGTLVTTFDLLIDKFLESFFGKYGRPDEFQTIDWKLEKLSDADAFMKLTDYINFLNTEIPKLVQPSDTDLLNIRDEMVGILNNNIYLFGLK
jgi:hypothetical protein